MLISDRRDDSPNVFSSSVELSYMGVVGDMTGVIGLRSSSFSSSGSTGGWASAKCKKTVRCEFLSCNHKQCIILW